MVFLFLGGCSVLGLDDPFNSNSGRYDQPNWATDDTADGDTGDTADGGGDAGAPELTNLLLAWTEYPNIGTVLEFTADYTDEGDDIVGGTCYIDLFNGSEYIDSYEYEVVDDPAGEGEVCSAVGGALRFAFQELDETLAGSVGLEVKDGSGNVSATYDVSTLD